MSALPRADRAAVLRYFITGWLLLTSTLSPLFATPVSPATPAALAEQATPPTASEQIRSGERFAEFFAPFQSEMATMSPDGKFLAYSMREADVLSIVIVEIDNPAVARAKVAVISDKQATPIVSATSAERVPARINWMRWISPTRLVLETNRIFATTSASSTSSQWTSVPGEIIALDADGQHARTLADARRVTPMDPSEVLNFRDLPNPGEFTTTGSGAPESTGSGEGATALAATGYRSPRVLGFDPDRPESLLVLGHTLNGCGLYSLHTSTGKLRYLEEKLFDSRMVMLLDRAGSPRVGVAYRSNKRFPLPFVLEGRKFGKTWRALDEIAAEAGVAEGFSISPANYFARRHVPLGFGPDSSTLFYASNVGRDTYGIYALNLATKSRAETSIESPAVDLWEPVPGVFPDLAASWTSQGVDSFALANAVNDFAREELAHADVTESGDDASPPLVGAASTSPGLTSFVSTTIQPARNTDDALLVFDRYTQQLAGIRIRGSRPTTQWLKRELAEAQAILEKQFSPNAVDIREWDATSNRFLLTVSGPALPGAWYVFDRAAARVSEFVARAPWLDGVTSPTMLAFSFTSPQQVPVKGLITVPRSPRLKPIPAVFVTPRMPWQAWSPTYRTEIQALADMGFAVVEYSGRGAWGRGVTLRERIHDGYEDAQVEDLLATATYVAEHFAVAPQRFAVMGIDHGGHVALRALELAPERFRAAVAIGAPVNLRAWLGELEWRGAAAHALLMEPMFGSRKRQSESPLVRDLAMARRPALLFNYRGPSGAQSTGNYAAARNFAAALNRQVPATEIVDLSDDYMNGLPKARAAVFARIEEFLNANIYDYAVKAGELKVDEPE